MSFLRCSSVNRTFDIGYGLQYILLAQCRDMLLMCCRSRKRQIEVKKARAEAQEAADKEFAAAWQKRLEQLKAEEVSFVASAISRITGCQKC